MTFRRIIQKLLQRKQLLQILKNFEAIPHHLYIAHISKQNFEFLHVDFIQIISQQIMNRSVSKTRHQLDRIAYKIGQLREKHSIVSDASPHPKYHSKTLNEKLVIEPKQYPTERAFKQINNFETEISPIDQLKKQLVQYVDKGLLLQQQHIKESFKQFSLHKSSYLIDLEEKFKRIENDVTRVISTNQEVLVTMKRNQYEFADRMREIQDALEQKFHQVEKVDPLQQDMLKIMDHLNEKNQWFQKIRVCERKIEEQEQLSVDYERGRRNQHIFIEQQQQLQRQMRQLEKRLFSFEQQKQSYRNYEKNEQKIKIEERMNELQKKQKELVFHNFQSKIKIEMEKIYLQLQKDNEAQRRQFEEFENTIRKILQDSQSSRQIIDKSFSDPLESKLTQFQNNVHQLIKNFYQDWDEKLIVLESIKKSVEKIGFQCEENQRALKYQQQDMKQAQSSLSLKIKNLDSMLSSSNFNLDKLNNNFSYIHEQMSKIQYDNALFKDKIDKLTVKYQIPSTKNTPQKKYDQQKPEQRKNMLNILQSCSPGKFFANSDF